MDRRDVLSATALVSFGIVSLASPVGAQVSAPRQRIRVLTIGLDPSRRDPSQPLFDPALTPAAIIEGVQRDATRMTVLGFDREEATGSPEEVLNVARAKLSGSEFEVVVIGAGMRLPPENFLLFEQMVNLVHELAPRSKLAFNTRPDDSTEAIQRWLPSDVSP